MLLPASVLLLTVLAIPMLQHQWALIVYTFGVVLLGFFLYAALQVARRLGVSFFHNPTVSCDVWTSSAITASCAALPAYVCGVILYYKVGSSMVEVLAFALLLGSLVGLATWGLICRAAHKVEQPYTSLGLPPSYSLHIFSVPDAEEKDPTMQCSQHDSVVRSVPLREFSSFD
jgi:predicted permease